MKYVICFGFGLALGVKLAFDVTEWDINRGALDDWMLQNMEERGRIKIRHKDKNEEDEK